MSHYNNTETHWSDSRVVIYNLLYFHKIRIQNVLSVNKDNYVVICLRHKGVEVQQLLIRTFQTTKQTLIQQGMLSFTPTLLVWSGQTLHQIRSAQLILLRKLPCSKKSFYLILEILATERSYGNGNQFR